jgi:heme exporter protein A
VRAFGGRRAVDRVDVAVPAGTRLAVVGPNGAGKSTLLRMLATLSRPDAGTLRIAGCDCPDAARRARAHIGYLGHDPLVYLDLSPWQNLELFASLYGVTGTRDLIPASLAEVGLLARAHDPVRTFSRGMAQRLGIARLTLHGPSVLLLDEPYTGLDAQGARLLDGLLGDTAAGRSVVMVTHELGRALALADRVMVMRAGRVVHLEDTAATDTAAFAERYRELTA